MLLKCNNLNPSRTWYIHIPGQFFFSFYNCKRFNVLWLSYNFLPPVEFLIKLLSLLAILDSSKLKTFGKSRKHHESVEGTKRSPSLPHSIQSNLWSGLSDISRIILTKAALTKACLDFNFNLNTYNVVYLPSTKRVNYNLQSIFIHVDVNSKPVYVSTPQKEYCRRQIVASP